MVPKGPNALESPVSSHTQLYSSQNNINTQVNDAQAPTNGAVYGLSGSNIEFGQDRDARIPYHQPTSAMDGAPHGQEDFAPLRAAARVRRQDPVDDEASSRAKMWDPVKDCSDPNTLQADLPAALPGGHNSSEQSMDSTTRNATRMDLPFCHDDHPYGQGQGNRQHSTNSGTTGSASMGQFPYPQSHPMASGYQGSALMDLLPYLQPHAIASGYQGSASMASQALQVGHPYDQFQRSRRHQSGYEDISILPPHLSESSGQNRQQSLESITRGTSLMGIQPRQASYLHGFDQENRQQHMALEPGMPAPMASHELSRPWRSSSLTNPNSSTHSPTSKDAISAKLDYEQAHCLQRQNPSANMSRALGMARYAESLDQQSNYEEAVGAYEQACALFQEAIIRSYNLEERIECNNARNAYQARLKVLLQESAASQRNPLPEQDDPQEDDSPGRGKPQYSLLEDWLLCHKGEEDLSWQEVAETPTFKGKRKHRSLSQRKHTICKMGPKYHEVEKPWTVEEDRKLCALGDAGKTLGDIHRKFRCRNAERCVNRYFYLKGYHTTGRSPVHTSHQARQAPAQDPRSTQHTHSSSVVARHRGYLIQSRTSAIDPVSHRQSLGTALRQTYQVPPTSGQNTPYVSTPNRQTPGMPVSSSAFTSPEAVTSSTTPMSLNETASTLTSATQSSDSMRYAILHEPPRQHGLVAAPSSSSLPGAGPNKSTPSMSFDTSPSLQAVGNENTDRLFNSRRKRPVTSASSPFASTADTPNKSTPPTSPRNSLTTPSSPPETHDSTNSQSAAANEVRKSRRTAHLNTT